MGNNLQLFNGKYKLYRKKILTLCRLYKGKDRFSRPKWLKGQKQAKLHWKAAYVKLVSRKLLIETNTLSTKHMHWRMNRLNKSQGQYPSGRAWTEYGILGLFHLFWIFKSRLSIWGSTKTSLSEVLNRESVNVKKARRMLTAIRVYKQDPKPVARIKLSDSAH